MVTYTEIYDNNLGIKDISASRFHYLVKCKGLKYIKKRNKNKYDFMRTWQKSHYDYIVYNPDNIKY